MLVIDDKEKQKGTMLLVHVKLPFLASEMILERMDRIHTKNYSISLAIKKMLNAIHMRHFTPFTPIKVANKQLFEMVHVVERMASCKFEDGQNVYEKHAKKI